LLLCLAKFLGKGLILVVNDNIYDELPLYNSLYREAIALAKSRLSPLDPALEELYTLWAQQLTKDGNYEQAAKWYESDCQFFFCLFLAFFFYDSSTGYLSTISINSISSLTSR
jgi:hypothetical protein